MFIISKSKVSRAAGMAFLGTSFDPERRSSQAQSEYVAWAERIRADLEAANVPAEIVSGILERFTARFNGWLHSRSNCVSSFIAGPSNFPVRRAEKANRAEHNKFEEMQEWSRRVVKKLCNRYSPNPNIIRSGDSEAVAKLRAKIAKEEESRNLMKKTNAAWRKYSKSGDPASLLSLGLSQDRIDQLSREIEQAYSWEKQPFPSWQLSNLGANIRRLKQRLAGLEQIKSTPRSVQENGDVKMVVNTEAHRLQLFFPKDRIDIRRFVKSHGFRFSPNAGNAWQRHLSYQSEQLGKQVLAMA